MLRITIALSLALLTPLGGWAQKAKLNLFIWSEYVDPAVVADFAKQFDCQVVIDLYEDDASMMAKLQAGGLALYDLVAPPDHRVPAMVELGLLAPLRLERIPNLKNLDERFLNPPFDRGNKHTVAYQWGTVGLFARPPSGQRLPETWGLLFDPQQQCGPFVLMDSPRDLLAAALRYKGYSLNSTNPKELKEVRDLLLQAKRRCVGFEGSVGGKNKVLGKVAQVAQVYSGEAARGMREDKQTCYLLPREGSILWVDSLAVLAKAPHRDLAERFINFALEARNGARISGFTQFASPNWASRAFLNPDDLGNPAIYPPPEAMKRVEFLNVLGAGYRLYDEVWTQLKAK
jgi:spermidine/putrescine transport system substrate-binding protein